MWDWPADGGASVQSPARNHLGSLEHEQGQIYELPRAGTDQLQGTRGTLSSGQLSLLSHLS